MRHLSHRILQQRHAGDVRSHGDARVRPERMFGGQRFDGKHVEDVGMLKMDFLGLRTLTVMDDCINSLKREKGVQGMPWQTQAMKDAPCCEKLRGAARKL